MDSHKQQASDRIKQATNILVTVSANPSVDQLAACIGLTISLNKMGKHATAVFSGEVPSTLEFLQPEKTIEKNTDSLRDFIIALDKSKADKLRYKVEDRVVKIFITPYRTSITDKDLEFSQGDFNVDVIATLGVHNQDELDLAITSHGRILHDATIITVNNKPGGELGSINWLDPTGSSLSEMAVGLVNSLDKTLIDGQVATAFLTGIVAETDRFSNAKTTPTTMSVSAQLMSSGANQQLVATKLQEPVAPPPPPPVALPIATQKPDTANEPAPVKKSSDGTLEITHDETKTAQEEEAEEDEEEQKRQPKPEDKRQLRPEASEFHKEEKRIEPLPPKPPIPPVPAPQIRIDEHGSLRPFDDDEALLPPVEKEPPEISHHHEAPKMVDQNPKMQAGSDMESYDPLDSPGLPGIPSEEGEHPDSMDKDEPAVGLTVVPPEGEDSNAPGTSFLGDQPIVADEAKETSQDVSPAEHPLADNKKPEAPEHEDDFATDTLEREKGKTLSDIEQDVHSTHVHPSESDASTTSQGMALPAPQPEIPTTIPDPITSTFADNGTMLPPPSESAGQQSVAAMPNAGDELSVPNMPTPDQSALAPDLNGARDLVNQAMTQVPAGEQTLDPIQSLNARPWTPQSSVPPASDVPVTNPVDTTQPQSQYNAQPMQPMYSPPGTSGVQLPMEEGMAPPVGPPPMTPPPIR